MNQPPIRQFTPESPSGPGMGPNAQNDPLVPYFRRAMALINEFLVAAGQPAKLKSGRDLALNSEWGYLADTGVYVIEIQADFFPAYFYTPIGQCSPLAFAALTQAQFDAVFTKLSMREINKSHGQGGRLLAWVDKSVNSDNQALPEFIGRDQVDYHSLVARWAQVRAGLQG